MKFQYVYDSPVATQTQTAEVPGQRGLQTDSLHENVCAPTINQKAMKQIMNFNL